MTTNAYDATLAEQAVANGSADIVAFGKLYNANPDLVERLRTKAPLNAWDQSTFYGGGEKGYTDYSTLQSA
ncbi:N-ethylmaleimide reductase [compost metagenome]